MHVIKAEELVGFIRNYERGSRFGRFSPELVKAMVDHLQLLHENKMVEAKQREEQPSKASAAQF